MGRDAWWQPGLGTRTRERPLPSSLLDASVGKHHDVDAIGEMGLDQDLGGAGFIGGQVNLEVHALEHGDVGRLDEFSIDQCLDGNGGRHGNTAGL